MRRLAWWVAWHIGGERLIFGDAITRSGVRFRADPRLPLDALTRDAVHADNRLDRGHVARRADLLWVRSRRPGRPTPTRVPREHWNVILYRLEDGLRFRCFVLTQQIDPGLRSATGYLDDFDTYAGSVADLETRTGLTFPGLGVQAGVRDGLAAPGPVLVTDALDVRW